MPKRSLPSSLHRPGHGLHGRQRPALLPRLLLRISPDTPNPNDKDKTAFITPHGIYYYQVMIFGLKNAGATYQNAIQKCLKSQIGKNVKAYVDDVVVKTTEEDQLFTDLTETFTNLQEFQWKINPTKCVFGVPSGLLLGFMVGHRGIEANLVKVNAIRRKTS
jgi:hypothetical protein